MTQRSIDRLSEVATRVMRWLVGAVGLLVAGLVLGGVGLVRALRRPRHLG